MDLVASKFQAMEEAFMIQIWSEEVALSNNNVNTDLIFDAEEVMV